MDGLTDMPESFPPMKDTDEESPRAKVEKMKFLVQNLFRYEQDCVIWLRRLLARQPEHCVLQTVRAIRPLLRDYEGPLKEFDVPRSEK